MCNYKRLTKDQKKRRMLLFGCVDSEEFKLANKILNDFLKQSNIKNNKNSVKNVQDS